jgi:ketosteroid isomerase-like protein
MKKILLLIAILPCFSMLHAQSRQEKAVQTAVEELRKAIIDANGALLENLTASQLSYGHSSGQLDDKKTFVEKIVSGKSDFVSIDLVEQTISISGKVALVRHILHAKTNDGGKPGEVHLRILLVWQKKGGQWKLLARQAVKMS